MLRLLISTILVGATLLTAGCANSVLHDPEEMARRKSFVERQQAGWDEFWGGGSGSGGSTASTSGGGNTSSSAQSVRTYEPRRCYQTSATHQTCFD